jgi:hypothetical protein
MFDIPVQILGTNGEPAGTPVTLRLESNIGGASPANFYLPSQVYLIEGFKTGDTFRYWAGLHGGFQTAANFLSVLSVKPPAWVSPHHNLTSKLRSLHQTKAALTPQRPFGSRSSLGTAHQSGPSAPS